MSVYAKMSTPNRFRFRAWDNIHKVMIKACTPLLRGGISSELLACTCAENDGLGPCDACDGIYGERAIIMQSTGLCDKNGKEIFEGDIIQFKDKKLGGGCDIIQGNVLWQDTFNNLRVYTSKYNQFYRSIMSCCDKVVVGNIYDNPELLK